MNIDLKSDKGSFVRRVFSKRFTREETAEVIVPDALPDILRILDTDGYMCLRGKDSTDGHVTVTGTAELTVLYVPESGEGVRKLTASIPMELSCDGEEITADSLITATLTLTGADSRTVNPRKIVARAECACEAALYMPETVYSTAPREREGVYFKTGSETMRLPVSVGEKTFIITDDARLPESAPEMGELLGCVTALTLESAKPVGSRAVVKGAAETTVLYVDREGNLCREALVSPFSQIVETDAAGEPAELDVALSVTGAYATRSLMDETGGDGLSLEIHAVAQCVAYADRTFDMVTDAYSVQNPMELHRTSCTAEKLAGRETVTEEMTVSVPTGDRAAKVASVGVMMTGSGIRTSSEGRVYAAGVCVTVIYADKNGELLSASRRAELEKPVEEGVEIVARIAGKPNVTVTEESIEARVILELTKTRHERAEVAGVESVELDEEHGLDKSAIPAVTVVRGGKMDLWELAKRFLSTPQLILEASGLEEDCDMDSERVLLVPRM